MDDTEIHLAADYIYNVTFHQLSDAVPNVGDEYSKDCMCMI